METAPHIDLERARIETEVYKKYEGKPLDTAELKTGAQLYEFFNQVLPDFDQDRVYTSDIKKVVNWYNALVGAGFTEFKTEEPQEEETDKQ